MSLARVERIAKSQKGKLMAGLMSIQRGLRAEKTTVEGSEWRSRQIRAYWVSKKIDLYGEQATEIDVDSLPKSEFPDGWVCD